MNFHSDIMFPFLHSVLLQVASAGCDATSINTLLYSKCNEGQFILGGCTERLKKNIHYKCTQSFNHLQYSGFDVVILLAYFMSSQYHTVYFTGKRYLHFRFYFPEVLRSLGRFLFTVPECTLKTRRGNTSAFTAPTCQVNLDHL